MITDRLNSLGCDLVDVIHAPVPHRFFLLTVGGSYAYRGGIVRLERFTAVDAAVITNIADGTTDTVGVDELSRLSPSPSTSPVENRHAPPNLHMPDPNFDPEGSIHAAITPIIQSLTSAANPITNEEMKRHALVVGISPTKLRSLIRRYKTTGRVVIRYQRGRKKGQRVVGVHQERFIQEAIGEIYEAHRICPWSAVHSAVETKCVEVGIKKIPCVNTVKARILAKLPRAIALARGDREQLQATRLVEGEFQAANPLDIAQLDFTVADLVIVDDIHRRPMGRPLLGLLIDMFSRVVLGGWLFLEAPSHLTAGWMIYHAVWPKASLVKALGCGEFTWPCFGRMRRLYVDNGFRIAAFQEACARRDIDVSYRIPGEPQSGGMIERLIGTFVGRMHMLHGTTYANPLLRKRSKYDPDSEARYTLREAMQFLISEIHRYHHSPHRALDKRAPIEVWNQGFSRAGECRAPLLPSDSQTFFLPFLWNEERRITREGISLNNVQYRSPDLAPYVGSKVRVYYNRSSPIHVFPEISPDHFLKIPAIGGRDATVSWWVTNWLGRQQVSAEFDEDHRAERAKAHRYQTDLAQQARVATEMAQSQHPVFPPTDVPKPKAAVSIDFSRPPQDLSADRWENER